MKILIADNMPEFAIEQLRDRGLHVSFEPHLKNTALTAHLADLQPEILIVRSTKVMAEHIAAAPTLQLIVRAGAGVNTIDLDAASAQAVSVANCPGMNAIAVAELTFGHIINADRRIADNVADLRSGQWRKKHYSKAQGLKGRTLGVIGCGAIARAVIARGHAFEMNIVCCAPELDEALARELGVTRCENPIAVAQRCSILTVHVPKSQATHHLVGPAVFDALPPGAIVVNTSRGGIVDEAALADAVTSKGVRAGLDVFDNEPAVDGQWDCPTAHLEGVYATHHIGASTEQAQSAVAHAACQIALTWWEHGEAENCVNLARTTSANYRLIVRHLDQVGALASLLELLRKAGLNVQGMSNDVYSGANAAACARIHLQGKVDDELLAELRETSTVIDVQLISLQ
jgi:D-3-phosphoglycerate dehydrogenase